MQSEGANRDDHFGSRRLGMTFWRTPLRARIQKPLTYMLLAAHSILEHINRITLWLSAAHAILLSTMRMPTNPGT